LGKANGYFSIVKSMVVAKVKHSTLAKLSFFDWPRLPHKPFFTCLNMLTIGTVLLSVLCMTEMPLLSHILVLIPPVYTSFYLLLFLLFVYFCYWVCSVMVQCCTLFNSKETGFIYFQSPGVLSKRSSNYQRTPVAYSDQ